MSRWIDIGPVSALNFGPGAAVKVENSWLAVFPLGTGYRAIDNPCPHAGAPLCDGAMVGDGKVACFLHCCEFDLTTGACDVGAEWSVRTYDVRELDGRLQVELP